MMIVSAGVTSAAVPHIYNITVYDSVCSECISCCADVYRVRKNALKYLISSGSLLSALQVP